MRKLPESGPPGSKAAMMVPVKHEGGVVGVVQVMSNSAEYSFDQLELVDGLVQQMAAAVRNARLQKEQRRLEAAEFAARAVATEREQAANVLDAVGDGIFLVDGAGVIRLWNRAAALVTGMRGDAVRNVPVVDVFPEWEALVERIPVVEHGAAARTATLPVHFGTRDLWLSFVAVSIPDGIVYAFRDLTSERTLEEEKSDFIATISHELRTPMAAVYGAAQTLLMRDSELTPEQKQEMLEMVATQSARLGQITEAVLLATQLDRGTPVVESEAVDVGELTRATVEAMRPAAARIGRSRPRDRAAGRDGVGRTGPDPAGARQPPRQRRQVRRRGDRQRARGAGQRRRAHPRGRHRPGHPIRGAAADLREVLPLRA